MDELEPKEGVKLSIWNAIIPIGALIISALVAFYYSGYSSIMSGEPSAAQEIMINSPFSFKGIMEAFAASDASVALFQSALFASIVAILMGVVKKIFTLSEAIEVWVDGMKGLIITGVILILAWSLGSVIKELGTAYYLVEVLKGAIPAFLLPSLIFVLGAVISFSTGTCIWNNEYINAISNSISTFNKSRNVICSSLYKCCVNRGYIWRSLFTNI